MVLVEVVKDGIRMEVGVVKSGRFFKIIIISKGYGCYCEGFCGEMVVRLIFYLRFYLSFIC